jgi:myosin-crossreactive antigen
MPYITSMFMPRTLGDRPLPVPSDSKNLGFVSQFVEIPDNVVFAVEKDALADYISRLGNSAAAHPSLSP